MSYTQKALDCSEDDILILCFYQPKYIYQNICIYPRKKLNHEMYSQVQKDILEINNMSVNCLGFSQSICRGELSLNVYLLYFLCLSPVDMI